MNEPSKDGKYKKKSSWIKKISKLVSRKPKNMDQLTMMMRDAAMRGVLSAESLGMIESILHVSETQVREVMIPKVQMVIIDQTSSLEDILQIVIESGHSRFPVIDRTSNDVVGILLAKDLLRFYSHHNNLNFNLDDILRPVFFTPQSKRLDILLREFRSKRNHLAIVLDEYGHVEGLITIEDVLEQIVGDIEDEYDIDEEDGHIKKLNDGSYIVKASTEIEEFNDYFKSHFSDEEFDTVGGIILKSFGYVPKRGETIKIEQFRFKILHSDNRRVYLFEVRVSKKQP